MPSVLCSCIPCCCFLMLMTVKGIANTSLSFSLPIKTSAYQPRIMFFRSVNGSRPQLARAFAASKNDQTIVEKIQEKAGAAMEKVSTVEHELELNRSSLLV